MQRLVPRRRRRLLEPLLASHTRRSSCDLLAARRIKSPLRLQHCFGDALISPTTTKISAHTLANAFRIVAHLTFLHETYCAHDLPRCAEAALQTIMSDKGLLHWMQPI